MLEFPQHSFLHGVYSLCVSRYNNTLFLNRLQEGEGGLYTFYALNNEINASVTFSISVKCKCLALPGFFHPACPGAAAQLAASMVGSQGASSPTPTGHTARLRLGPSPNLYVAQGFLMFYCCTRGK